MNAADLSPYIPALVTALVSGAAWATARMWIKQYYLTRRAQIHEDGLTQRLMTRGVFQMADEPEQPQDELESRRKKAPKQGPDAA